MNRVTNFYTSSVGRKLMMGLTGFFLSSFLVVHLYINLFLFRSDGGRTFDTYSEFMATYPLIRPLEIVLFLGFFLHMVIGGWLWWTNRKARPQRYAGHRLPDTSALQSRVTFWTGMVVLAFLVVHINSFFIRSRFLDRETPMYEIVSQVFSNPWYDAFYVLSMVFLGYHLLHGFQSAFQTFGIRGRRYETLIAIVAIVFWLLIPACFAAMPLYFFWAH
jgi:succinate dehydrogenase / fumarate reductase cytochrome b subunit